MIEHQCTWVLLERFCELTGYTEEAVKMKRKNGVWPEGIVTMTRNRRIHVNLEAYDKWVEGRKLSAVA